jgi:predicted nucleotide-binding protein
MRKKKNYPNTAFTPAAVRKIYNEAKALLGSSKAWRSTFLHISRGDDRWDYDNLEEFFSELRVSFDSASLRAIAEDNSIDIEIELRPPHLQYSPSVIGIAATSRENILRIANVVEECASECFVAPPVEAPLPPRPKPIIFIGHGGSNLWRDLKDHLHDQHGYTIEAYETGSRAGHTIRDVLGQMLLKSSFGLLVMTAEDKQDDGSMRARQNVIHEIGLFQGRLGFSKAIVLKEDGTEEFSNLHGVVQLRFSRGNIKETFGDILAVLKREFED